MTQRDKAIHDLSDSGYHLDRHGKKHDLYYNPELRCSITLKRGHFDEGDLRYIRKEIRENRERGK